MFLHHIRYVILMLAIAGTLCVRVEAQLITGNESLVDKFNALLPIDHSRPMTIAELCHRLDCLNDALRNDGLIVLKQPDVFSQARLTRFRNDVDQQMSNDLGNFHLVLAARINRLDSATTTSTTALGAALAAPGTSNVQAPTASAASVLGTTNNLFSGGPSLLGTQPTLGQGAFGSLGLASNNFNSASAASTAAIGLGVEPTVYLDEKKRFLDHLNQIRRINMGPDQNDSSGYGLYLVRMPVSITPGECTYQGHGADLAITVEHEFTPDFLPSTFRNLVINDVADQLGPVIYELIRSDGLEELKQTLDGKRAAILQTRAIEAQNKELLESRRAVFGANLIKLVSDRAAQTLGSENAYFAIAEPLTEFILRSGDPLTGDAARDQLHWKRVADRLKILNDALATARTGREGFDAMLQKEAANFEKEIIAPVRHGEIISQAVKRGIRERALFAVYNVMLKDTNIPQEPKPGFIPGNLTPSRVNLTLIEQLYQTALPDDVEILDNLLKLSKSEREITTRVASNGFEAYRILSKSSLGKIALPSVRSAKQIYPIAPRELIDFFLEENIFILASDAKAASRSKIIRLIDVRNYLRQTLGQAYDAMANSTLKEPSFPPPLADDQFMQLVLAAIHQREFGNSSERDESKLNRLYDALVRRLELSRENMSNKPIAALCWAIAVDAAILDFALQNDARKVFQTKGLRIDSLENVHFYHPSEPPNGGAGDAFREYVRQRWPIVTFALDPVTDQQNIADSLSLNRDLQLALSFAFSTGQINFSQLNTFRRQIQQSADTIALNRTVTGFIHGENVFGFRFTPRYQNPPSEQTNVGVIASQLIWGGLPPNYQMRKSKLEPGLRELTAILLIPTFLPTMRMNIAGNWFKLNDPEHLVFHTNRMMEHGRRVQELRQAVDHVCNSHEYRDADLRVLYAKLAQLDAMLPLQTQVIQLPFENSANGFDLFSEGATALVPELTGFSGVDVITAPATAAAGGGASGSTAAAGGATATATTPPATYSVTSLTSPPTTATYTIAGGTTSLGDVFVFGKYISLLDTRVIAGGKSASFEILSREVIHVQIPSNVIPTTTDDNKTYIEIYLATPNGISNSLLIPYLPATPPPLVAFDVAPASQSIDIHYQWLLGPDGKYALIATADPGKKGIQITWDSNTSVAPNQIQAQFSANVSGQNVVVVMHADADTKDDYNIDGQKFAVTLLKQLQGTSLTYPNLPPSPIPFTVKVQPFLPAEVEGLRIRSKEKTLKSKVTVNLQYNATGVNALPGFAPVPQSVPAAAPASSTATGYFGPGTTSNGPALAAAQGHKDQALIRTAQQVQMPSSFLNATQPPLALDNPALLTPNVSSEAEKISKILTGQPIATTVTIPPPALPASFAAAQASALSMLSAAPAAAQAAAAQLPQIVVTPSPVLVVSQPPQDNKHNQRKPSTARKMLTSIGNRLSQAFPGQ
jgi:hypothetical protein